MHTGRDGNPTAGTDKQLRHVKMNKEQNRQLKADEQS